MIFIFHLIEANSTRLFFSTASGKTAVGSAVPTRGGKIPRTTSGKGAHQGEFLASFGAGAIRALWGNIGIRKRKSFFK
jgi:hypothetical protein